MVMQNRGRGAFSGTRARGGDGHFLFNDASSLERLFSQQQMPSVAKELVHPGQDPEAILMRCIFKDERERNAAVLYLAKCREFGLAEEEKVLRDWLASTVSVRGLSRRELAMVSTGIIAPSLYPGVHEWGKDKERRKKEQVEE
jgi:hypothetical protein